MWKYGNFTIFSFYFNNHPSHIHILHVYGCVYNVIELMVFFIYFAVCIQLRLSVRAYIYVDSISIQSSKLLSSHLKSINIYKWRAIEGLYL